MIKLEYCLSLKCNRIVLFHTCIWNYAEHPALRNKVINIYTSSEELCKGFSGPRLSSVTANPGLFMTCIIQWNFIKRWGLKKNLISVAFELTLWGCLSHWPTCEIFKSKYVNSGGAKRSVGIPTKKMGPGTAIFCQWDAAVCGGRDEQGRGGNLRKPVTRCPTVMNQRLLKPARLLKKKDKCLSSSLQVEVLSL